MNDSYDKLVKLLEMTESEILEYLTSFLHGLNSSSKPIITHEFLYLNTGHPICLVAHIDTVRDESIQPDIVMKDGIITNKNGVLGADDRAGVHALMEIVEHCALYGGRVPSLLLTNYEESGCRGVHSFVDSGVLNVGGLRMFVEFDRKGDSDFVSYWRDVPPEVTAYLEAKGFTKKSGFNSDVAFLMNATDIPAVNLSIGFYNEHTSQEYLILDHMEENISRGIAICQEPIEQLYPVERPKEWNELSAFFERFERL